ncbi:hypothetical protein [Spirochaeta cellobiosiphila]|uniref:hypothetical protein n=1 Tax=Spirochaeta cellobiosiphila TaxID=504483 RepID=UPI000402E603|nr:hypothetical protein [Spirochaeta cellobiosiphila]
MEVEYLKKLKHSLNLSVSDSFWSLWVIKECEEASPFLYPGERLDGVYFVLKGQLHISSSSLDILIEEGGWLLDSQDEDVSIESKGACTLAYLSFKNLHSFVAQHKYQRAKLLRVFHQKQDDAQISLRVQRSWILWFKGLGLAILPIVIGSLLPLFFDQPVFYSSAYQWSCLAASVFIGLVSWILMGLEYISLDEKVLYYSKLSLFPLTKRGSKILYSDIQSLKLGYPNFLCKLFKLNRLEIITSNTHDNISMFPVASGDKIQQHIKRKQEDEEQYSEGRKRLLIRVLMEEHFNLNHWKLRPLRSIKEKKRLFRRKSHRLHSYFFLFIPWKQVIDGNTFRFRKHFLNLFIKVLPFLIITALYGGIAFSFPYLRPYGYVLLLMFVPLGYIWEDWRNDVYELGPQRLLDIEKKPLWIKEEIQELDLNKIVSVEIQKKGFSSLLFDYGDLIVRTVGQQGTPLTFKSIPHPLWVQERILDCKEEIIKKQEMNQRMERFKEYPLLLDVYHQLMPKLVTKS